MIFEQDLEYIATADCFDREAFREKTFLISGATGLIGSLCIRALLYMNRKHKLNLRVIGIARDAEKAKQIYEGDDCPEFIYADLISEDLPEEIGRIDYVIHAAAVTNSKFMVSHPVDTIMTSINGTVKMLDYSVQNKVEAFLYVSSMEAYGNVEGEGMVTEDILGYIPINEVRSCYPESKRMCENLCISYASQYHLKACCARLAQTFGAGILPGENRVFAQFARSAIRKKDIVLHTTGESEGNYVYSSDAVTAILMLLQKGSQGEIYNVNNQESHCQIREMAEMVAREVSGEISVSYDIPDNKESYGYAPTVRLHLSSQKINSLGWKAQTGLKEAYVRTIRYMLENEKEFLQI